MIGRAKVESMAPVGAPIPNIIGFGPEARVTRSKL